MSISIGKVVLTEGYTGPYETTQEDAISVDMSSNGISFTHKPQVTDPRERLYPQPSLRLTPEQAIEMGQLLLKAGELQPQYATDVAKINEDLAKMHKRYQDIANGLGLDADIDVDDEHRTFTTSRALT